MNATELREKLDDLIIELDRLDNMLDLPVGDLTIGEYEQEREKLLDEFIQAIAATLGRGTCRLDPYTDARFSVCQAPDETDFLDYADVCECTACGASVMVPHEYERVSCKGDDLWPRFNYCPNCGREVVDE